MGHGCRVLELWDEENCSDRSDELEAGFVKRKEEKMSDLKLSVSIVLKERYRMTVR